ncbi:MAG: hypothetical protein M3443_14325 [Actinomycetota bacterium]|nr:hypothetical protein [Actinomycetota bacterium]
MAFGTRISTMAPLAGAAVAAMALAGVAVFTVTSAGCADAGTYVQHDGQVELVGGCLDPADLPAAPQNDVAPASDAGTGLDRARHLNP